MIGREIHAVHGVSQQRGRFEGALDRHRPAEFALVESDQVDIDRVRADSCKREHRGERGPAPLGTADPTGAPLTTGGRLTQDRPPKAPPVAPTFQVRHHRLIRQGTEVIHVELDHSVDRVSLDTEPISRGVDSRRGRVVADEKELVGGDHSVEQFKPGLEVRRMLYERLRVLHPGYVCDAQLGA